ncbi:MAG TPA: hypothetical protein VJ851_09400 [Jatrophihabitans sp.]|nr:hypothetical protein [Jatrophihabitans sp.]
MGVHLDTCANASTTPLCLTSGNGLLVPLKRVILLPDPIDQLHESADTFRTINPITLNRAEIRRFWTLILTPVLALVFLLAGSPAANAFGSEVLGCAWNGGTWTANTCGYGDADITFSPQGLSGTYSYRWTISISGTGYNSIVSGCTTTSTTCTLDVQPSTYQKRNIDVALQLTQSGVSRTISATAYVYSSSGCVRPAC